VAALERHPDNRELIGQWSDAEHAAAIAGEGGRSHWIVEGDGARAGYLIAYDCRHAGAGFYVKRVLVESKGRGTGSKAVAAFLDHAFAQGADHVWLIVRNGNDRARAVYEKLGFERFEPGRAEASRYDRVAEAPPEKCFRMRRAASSPPRRAR
jgi:ribosomal protein S18 acetylase RimI-like enzyme